MALVLSGVWGEGASPSICFDTCACPQGVQSCVKQSLTASVQSSVCDYDIACSCGSWRACIPLKKRTRSTSKTHLNGMTGPWARHLQQVLSAGNSRPWVMCTKRQCEGPRYLRWWAESQRSGIVLWLFGIYLVIRPLKRNGGMKALALLNLLLLAYSV